MRGLKKHHPATLTSAAAGVAGGLAASWAMGLFDRLLLKASGIAGTREGSQDPTVRVAEAVSERALGHQLSAKEKPVAGTAVHLAFGSTMGGVYGALAGANVTVSAGAGVPFGAALWAAAHVAAVPALGLSKPPLQRPLAEEVIEFGSHLLYGMVTDGVRRLLLWAVRA